MDAFQCLRLSVLAEAKDYISLPPYQGGTLRGAFGYALKGAVCTFENRECGDCLLKDKCVYSYVFETPLPADAEVLRLYPYAPHPFVIGPMANSAGGKHHPGSQIRFGMTLVGRAMEYLPYFAYAFIRMGKAGIGKGRGRFHISQIDVTDEKGDKVETVFQNEKLSAPETVLDYGIAEKLADIYNPETVSVSFRTPLRVKYRGHFHDVPEFHILVRNLLRRLSNLLYFHCGQRIDLPFAEIIKRAESVEMIENQTRWFDWKRYSGRQHKPMKMGGIVGRAIYKGNLTEFLPMLVMGTWINIGKGTSFGLGSYTVG